MKKSLALSILAAMAGSVYATPAPKASAARTNTAQTQTQSAETNELTEKQRIMLEVRRQVGRELQDS